MKWKKIETAPKEGTVILLTNGELVATGAWHDGGNKEPFDGWDGSHYGSHLPRCDYWALANTAIIALPFSRRQPTHWMPLPKPPTTTA